MLNVKWSFCSCYIQSGRMDFWFVKNQLAIHIYLILWAYLWLLRTTPLLIFPPVLWHPKKRWQTLFSLRYSGSPRPWWHVCDRPVSRLMCQGRSTEVWSWYTCGQFSKTMLNLPEVKPGKSTANQGLETPRGWFRYRIAREDPKKIQDRFM